MMSLPEYFYDVNLFTVAFRLFLAVVFGGIIGLERGANKHAAGFRTHILVCIGACLAMLTNQFIFTNITEISDPSRMGAQVITGVGFLGVGTILVTGGHKIKGLTTAAGLWTSACIGLALGIGFYSGAFMTVLLVYIALALLPKVETFFYHRSRIMDLYIELDSLSGLNDFLCYVKSLNIRIQDTQLSKTNTVSTGEIGFHLSIKIPKEMDHLEVIEKLKAQKGIYLIEEI
ncbi:MgtC/SapB family protein [Sinanaerobacter chloroacetimidivorans]|uniref:MgtC/SapB family protein n=1 Tax=Sinanaerobacter chloroacetimidivorans TaxID=2818044 RepID=A0A8J7W3R8_9FIRM|nr:MgtC/SapB family protein [Sinanaerobacter chloroacetimidivorans]MBR0600347.1 MgtC/SapB family protein [Sinanaerobacter chloroacetimidivorans]